MLTATLLTLFTTALAAPQLASRQAAGEIQPNSIISHNLASPPAPNTCLAPGARPSTKRLRTPGGTETGASLLYTFTYPAASSGKQCWLEFTTTPPTTIRPNPGAQLDVFTEFATGSCVGGSTSNNRDNQLGRLNVPANGVATWAFVSSGHLTSKGPCAASGTTEGIEIVAVGDDGEVTFPQGAGAGLRIRFE